MQIFVEGVLVMKKILSVLLVVALCFTMCVSFAAAEEGNALARFTDAPKKDNWKHAGLHSAVENDIMKGHEDKIRPDDNITRAELTAMMVRVLGAQMHKADIEHYVDVAIDEWYHSYIQSGVAVKIINGAGNKMMPKDPITREQSFAILARTFVLYADSHSHMERFDDDHHVSDWAKGYTAALVEHKVVLGDEDNEIRPKDNVTRAEFAAMLYRLAGNYAKAGDSLAGKTIEGNLVVTSPDVDLTGVTVKGSIIITEAVENAGFEIKGATVEGSIVIRSGDVTLSGSTTAEKIIYGNPVEKVSAAAKSEEVKVQEIVVAENSVGVKNEVSAESVEIKSEGAEIVLGGNTSYGEVEVSGSNNKVVVEDGTKVEKSTISGQNNTVSGVGEGEGTPKPPVSVGGGGGGSYTSFILDSYITYGGQKVIGVISENTVSFDLSGLSDETVLDEIYIRTNMGGTFEHYLADFASGALVPIASIVDQIRANTNDQIVQIDDKFDMKMSVLRGLFDDAIFAYNLTSLDGEYVYRDLFNERGIGITADGRAIFHGMIGEVNVDLEITVKH